MSYTVIMPDFEAGSIRKGRRHGAITQFPGLVIYAREAGRTPTHLWRVLMGQRSSRTLVNGYAAFLRRQGQPWPVGAKVKPTAA